MPNERTIYLLQQYLSNDITLSELDELTELLLDEKAAPDLQTALDSLIDRSLSTVPPPSRYRWLPRRNWRLAAAAILLFVLAGSTFLLLYSSRQHPLAKSNTDTRIPNGNNDISPGGNKATLTLADGSAIDLGQAGNGTLGQQGNTQVVKLTNGQLTYRETKGHKQPASTEVAFNMLTTPRGGQYQLRLPDGSRVWLNAASSLRYPTAFSGKERIVQLQGEAYFEVARNASMPFKVQIASSSMNKPGTQIEVLGTHFNVMAYADEQTINTTLLEGQVKVHNGDQTALLMPGEQASLRTSGTLKVATVDTDEAIAWKNGLFRFNEATIDEVMRQISRWYDVEVVYVNGTPKDLFRGEIFRNVNVSKVLKVLEASGVHFTVEGKKILVQS
jgi:ferric-dicitrate binding protein FerR (iron transport regulator)